MQKLTELVTCYLSTANSGKHGEQWTEKTQRRTELRTTAREWGMVLGILGFWVTELPLYPL